MAVGVALAASLFVLPGTAIGAGPFEPNDSYITATGPITAGTVYKGAYETSNDEDFFYFYLPQLTQLEFHTTNTTPSNVNLCSEIYHQYSDHVQEVYGSYLLVNGGESKSGAVTLDPGKYYVVLGCPGTIGKTYSFSIGPAGVTSTYEPFAIACAAAQPPVAAATEQLQKAKRKLKAVKQRLASHPRWRFKHKQRVRAKIAELRHGVEEAFGAFKVATENAEAACSVPQ